MYFYDIEIYPNLFMVTFIPNVPDNIIKVYTKCDIDNNIKDKLIIRDNAIKPIKFIISKDLGYNDYSILIDFLSVHKILIGYNNQNYDNLILDYLYYFYNHYNNQLIKKHTNKNINEDLYEISQKIIRYGKGYNRIFYNEYKIFKYQKPYTGYDIQKILYLDKAFVSLKQVAIQLKWYRIQDLPLKYNINILKSQIEDIYDYNINDILITRELFNSQIKEIELRNNISEQYEINLRNQSRSGMSNVLAAKFYEEKSGINKKDFIDLRTFRHKVSFKDIISDKIKFKTIELQKVLFDLKSYSHIIGNTFNKSILFKETLYTFATGGLHSNDDARILQNDNKYTYRDVDVNSFYPYLITTLELSPVHLDKTSFLNFITDIVTNRIEAKNISGKLKKLKKTRELTSEELQELNKFNTITEALKIVVNAAYGKLGDKDSFLYDLKTMYSVTINGQLMLLMLCEELELNNLHVVSANTDGIVTKVDKDKNDLYESICNTWAISLDLGVEYTNYEKVIRTAVNDYIAIKEGFTKTYQELLNKYTDYWNIPQKELKELEENYIKEKGEFLTEISFNKGYFAPVIAKCLKARYVYNININEYFEKNTDIYDYCISQKISNDFYIVFRNTQNGKIVDTELQKNTRFYVTNGNGSIIKVYKNPKPNKKGTIIKEISMLAKCSVVIFNKFEYPPYKINYGFYKKQVTDTIVDIEQSNFTLF
jgi:hypothetical protein